ncbi:Helicase sen1 [Globisporangium polare]
MSSSAPALALRKKPKKRLSSGAAAQRDESEFVSVEVGMREFQRRLASSKNNGGNKESSRSTAVSSRSPSSRGQPRDKSDGALPPAPEQPKKRARTSTPAAATPTATQSTSSAVSAVRKSTATAPRARKPAASATGSTDPPVLQDPVKTPPKRAAPTQTAPAKARAKAPATATPAIKKPRAAPVARRQTTIAEIRAQLLREQQERVELRIQTLHCTNCNSVTHAHADEHVHTGAASDMPSVAAAPVVEPHRSIYEQQQERQQQPVTTHSVQYQPPLLLPIQHTAPLQAPAIHPKAVVRKEAPPALRVNAPASIAQPTVAAAPSEPDPIKNEFISDDFNEDMAFMLALDEVERSLTTPPALIMTPVVAPPSSLSGDLHQHFAPISTHPQPTGGSQMLGPSQPVRVKFKTEPSHQVPSSFAFSAMSLANR